MRDGAYTRHRRGVPGIKRLAQIIWLCRMIETGQLTSRTPPAKKRKPRKEGSECV